MASRTPVPPEGAFQFLKLLEDTEEWQKLRAQLRAHAQAVMNSAGLKGETLRNSFVDDAIRYVTLRGERGAANPNGLKFLNALKLTSYCRNAVWSRVQQYIREEYRRRAAAIGPWNEQAGSVHADGDSLGAKSPEAVLTERDELIAELVGKKQAHIRASLDLLISRLTPAARKRFEAKYQPVLHYPDVWRECTSGVHKISPNEMQAATGVDANLVTKDFKQLERVRKTLSEEKRLDSSFHRQMRGWDEK